MRRLVIAFAATFLALGTLPAAAQSLEAIEAAEQAVSAAWDAAPLSFRKVLYVTEAAGFGVYVEKPDAKFRQGEQIIVYAEPVGYGYKASGDGTYDLGFRVDLRIMTPRGKTVLEQNDFATLQFTSHFMNREFLLTLTLDISEAPAGDYVLEYTVHDTASDKTAPISLPFTIAE
ncbi:MAG: hypothetical protein Q8L54_09360 [Devosia sp.]|nr:hypothetical protein [Devosia sp.]